MRRYQRLQNWIMVFWFRFGFARGVSGGQVVAMSCSGLPLAKVYQIGELIRQSAAF